MGSILTSIKQLLGIGELDEHFDMDIILHINSVLMILNQIGVGPLGGYSIVDKTAQWTDYLGENKNLEAVKSYIYLKVRLIFDPPTISAVLEAMHRQITELEVRLYDQAEGG